MAGNPPPYPPPPYGPPQGDWRYQRRVMREHERMQRAMYRQQREAYKHQQAAYRYQSRRLRRSSIVGPILLLAIGLVFLLVQIGRLPGDRVWNWYGQWWPLLLIGVGVVVLLEWIVDRIFHHDGADGVPYVRRGVGGGVITLLAILAILGIVFQAIHRADDGFLAHKFGLNPDDLEQFLGDKHESDQTLLQALPAGGSLQVDNPRGDVTISGTSDDNQIHIMVHKEVYSRSDSDAADKAQKLSPAFTAVGSTL